MDLEPQQIVKLYDWKSAVVIQSICHLRCRVALGESNWVRHAVNAGRDIGGLVMSLGFSGTELEI